MLPEARLPSGARTTRLGFGCSALLGGRTRSEARRLLDAAYDSGVRHFDVARVYGTGDAEQVVGEFARGRRDSLTIASKFGIQPAAGTPALALGKRLVRVATRRSRRALAFARRHSGRTVRRGGFSPEQARESLSISLARLGVERLDAFLLHDCAAADWASPGLQEALAELRAAGQIGCFGPATAAPAVAAILAGPAPRPQLAQFEIRLLGGSGGAPEVGFAIVHGVYRNSLAALRARLAEPGATALWSERLGLDAASPELLGDLLLAAALRANPGGIVLVSAGSPERLARNAACAQAPPFEAAQLDAFLELAAAAASVAAGGPR